MTPQEFKDWRKRHNLTQAQTGEIFERTSRSIVTIEQSDDEVPALVALACDDIDLRSMLLESRGLLQVLRERTEGLLEQQMLDRFIAAADDVSDRPRWRREGWGALWRGGIAARQAAKGTKIRQVRVALRQHDNGMTADELCKKTGLNARDVYTALKHLEEDGDLTTRVGRYWLEPGA